MLYSLPELASSMLDYKIPRCFPCKYFLENTHFLPLISQGMLERVGTYIAHQNFCDGEDLARGRPATSSSVFEHHTAGEAVEGLMTEDTCFWSAPDSTHWWMVDLGGDVNVVKIRITNTVSHEYYDDVISLYLVVRICIYMKFVDSLLWKIWHFGQWYCCRG